MKSLHKMSQVPNLLIFTGAGLSAASGVPTFRDADGLWQNHRIEDVADYTTWRKNFDLVHAFYNARRQDMQSVQPNAAHEQIACWQREFPDQVNIFTQNIDLLLEAAGCTHVTHVHGEIDLMQCVACGENWKLEKLTWDCESDRCPACNSRRGVKPGVVFFNEHAPKYKDLYWAIKHMHENTWVLIVGTSGVVIDVQTLFGDHVGIKLLNNLQPHPAIKDDLFDHVLYESAHTALPKWDSLVRAHLTSHNACVQSNS
jgi:NAD-dependent deacetylase